MDYGKLFSTLTHMFNRYNRDMPPMATFRKCRVSQPCYYYDIRKNKKQSIARSKTIDWAYHSYILITSFLVENFCSFY